MKRLIWRADSAVCLAILGLCGIIQGAPGIINYQARLTDSVGVPLSTPVNLTFTFWDAESTGNQIGSGFSDTDLVTPNNGICSTDVGDDPGNPVPASVLASDSVFLNVNVDGQNIVPRARISSTAYALDAFSIFGSAYMVVEVTGDAVTNGSNLIAAYDRAKVLMPHGQALSNANRAVVLIPPGRYDMTTGQLTLDTEFVDVVGL